MIDWLEQIDVLDLLLPVALFQGAVVLILVVTLLVGGVIRDARARTQRPRIESGVGALAAGLSEGRIEPALADLKRLPRSGQLEAIARLSVSVSGPERRDLRSAAEQVGLTARAIAMAQSRRWPRRLHGARMLSLLGGGEHTMAWLLYDRNEEVRAQAVEWAADARDEGLVARLIELLADPSARVRFAAQDSLARVGRSAVEPLLHQIGALDPEPQATALRLASRVPDPRFLLTASALSRSTDAGVRAASLALLASLGGKEAVAALEAGLGDAEPLVRAEAAAGLGQLRHWPAATTLAGTLSDPIWRVRREGALALRAIGDTGILLLRRALSGEDPKAAEIAGHVLDLPAMTARELRL